MNIVLLIWQWYIHAVLPGLTCYNTIIGNSQYLSVIALLYCSTLGNALVTLFQLFTLDHWYDILRDLIKVVDSITVKIYIILWICIGAFIFRNIFAGIMGECIFNVIEMFLDRRFQSPFWSLTSQNRYPAIKNAWFLISLKPFFVVMNFQSIRNDFNQQVKQQTEALEAEQMRVHLAEELERQDRLHSRTR